MSYLRWSSSATKRRNSRATGTRFDAPLFHHDAPNPNGHVKKKKNSEAFSTFFFLSLMVSPREEFVFVPAQRSSARRATTVRLSAGERRKLWVTAR